MYTSDDIRPFAQTRDELFAWLRSHASMFFSTVDTTQSALMEHLVGEAVILGCVRVEAEFHDGWAIVGAEMDWFSVPSRVSVTEDCLFTRVFAFPEAGDNSCRTEVLVAAFARDVVTASAGRVRIIQGDVPPNDSVVRLLSETSRWRRAVAFRQLVVQPTT
jgi:hypothetical protein